MTDREPDRIAFFYEQLKPVYAKYRWSVIYMMISLNSICGCALAPITNIGGHITMRHQRNMLLNDLSVEVTYLRRGGSSGSTWEPGEPGEVEILSVELVNGKTKERADVTKVLPEGTVFALECDLSEYAEEDWADDYSQACDEAFDRWRDRQLDDAA